MSIEFQGCMAVSCVRQKTGPKFFSDYLIEEKCLYGDGKSGNNTCTFPKKEHKQIIGEANAEAK